MRTNSKATAVHLTRREEYELQHKDRPGCIVWQRSNVTNQLVSFAVMLESQPINRCSARDIENKIFMMLLEDQQRPIPHGTAN